MSAALKRLSETPTPPRKLQPDLSPVGRRQLVVVWNVILQSDSQVLLRSLARWKSTAPGKRCLQGARGESHSLSRSSYY